MVFEQERFISDTTPVDRDVVVAQSNDAGPPIPGLGFFGEGVAHDGETIPGLTEVGRGAVQNDRARTWLPCPAPAPPLRWPPTAPE